MNRRSVVVLLFSASMSANTIYSVVDLGTLGGNSSVAYGINQTGEAAGWLQNPGGQAQAFASSGRSVTINGSETYAYGINSSGQVAGISIQAGVEHGVVWSGNGVFDFGPNTYALAINDAGQVAGGNGHAFVYDGALHDLGALGAGSWSAAYGISNTGVAAGYGDNGNGHFQAFLWSAATGMVPLGTLGGADSYAMGINDAGTAVGHSTLADGSTHAFLASAGTLTDLGTLGGVSSFAYAVNAAGAAVGFSTTAGYSSHAFLYLNGAMFDLNTLIPPSAGWLLTAAYGINDAGQITGTGIFDGQSHAFRLDLVGSAGVLDAPEPSSYMLLAAGAAVLFTLKRRR